MLGYCTKDEGKPHYRMVRLNVTDEAIAAGKQAWATARLSYEDDRLVLTKKNLFQSVWASMCAAVPRSPQRARMHSRMHSLIGIHRALRSADRAPGMHHSFLEEITAFLNTFKCIPSAPMLMSYGGTMRSRTPPRLCGSW